ncbi:MAG: hypothetical protein WB773_06080, partial [Isosphaeraceae bacterium]
MSRTQLPASLPNGKLMTAEERFLLLKKDLHQQLITSMDLGALGTMNEEELRVEVRRAAEDLCRQSANLLNLSERDRLVNEVIDETFGLGPLEPLLADGGREKEPNRVTELQSKLEELTRSDPQKAEQDRIALERLLAELEEHTPPDRRRSTLELASDVLENPGEWLRTSNTQLGNRRPIDLMGT